MNTYPLKQFRFLGPVLFIIFILLAARQTDPHEDSLKKSMDAFQLEPGMRIDLVVAEPLVVDPVALAFDENRVMYVVEDRGYPDPPEGGSPTTLGRVARLTDTNGDGKYDKRTEFVDGLTYPNGIMPWRGGVFVTCSPNIYYFKDTDGDGIADVRKVVLTGFSATQTSQLRMSHPTLGMDGWVYVTAGLNGGKVTSPEHPERPAVNYTIADGRFNPDTFEFQATGGQSQFGLTFDTYGRRFGCSNRHPIMNTVIEPWYLRRNSNLLFNETVQNVSKAEADAVVFPISHAVTSADFIPKLIGRSHAGTFTAASGLMVFNGSGLTPAHQGNIFICESAQNLVQRQIVQPDGVSFKSDLPYKGREFLSSTDISFRPVFLQHGPEGGLYIVDMHREVIDHPSYIPEEARAGLNWEVGKTDGRIYRVLRKDFSEAAASKSSRLSSASTTTQLVAGLASSEEWNRVTAHRLMLERNDPASIPLLRTCATSAVFPESRARALWLLRSLGGLDLATEKKALADKVAGVREQAVLLAEAICKEHPELIQSLVRLATDPNIRVRFNTALSLGSLEGPGVVQALAKVAVKDGADKWARAAVLSGIEKRMPAFLVAVRKESNIDPVAFAEVMEDLGRLYGNGASVADGRILMQEVLSATGDSEWRISTVLGLAEGLTGRVKEFGTSPKGMLYAIQGTDATALQLALLEKFITNAINITNSATATTRLRVLATALLGYTSYDRSSVALQKLLAPTTPPDLLLQAVSSLSRLNDPRGAIMLTGKTAWAAYTPRVKSAVLASLVSKAAFATELLTAIEKGNITAVEISSSDRVRLMKIKNPLISDRAKMLFKELEGGDRMKVYDEYRKILDVKADPVAGKAIFLSACSACHTYNGQGGKVGPDLTGVKNQPPEALLLHIIVPNYEVMPVYQAVSISTNDGRSFSGCLVSETEFSLTLRTPFGTNESILRKNIANLSRSGRSLMPDGLEQTMTKDEMSKLIAYLKAGS